MFHFLRAASLSFSGSQVLETDVIPTEICLDTKFLTNSILQGIWKIPNYSIF